MILNVTMKDHNYDVVIERNSLDNIESYLDLNRNVLIVTDDGIPQSYVNKVLSKCNNGFVYTTFNPKKATAFAKSVNASDVEIWTFANDLLYKKLADNGLNLPTAFNTSGSNNYVLGHYDFDDKDAQKNGLIAKFITMSEIDMTFDAPETENAFTVGNYQVVPDGKRTDNYAGGFIIKTSTGKEYHCDISSQEIMEQVTYDDAAKYIKTILGA